VVGLSVADPVITKLVTPEAVSHLLAVGWPVGVVSDPPPSGTIGISTETLGTAWQIFGASHYGIARFEVSVPTVLLRTRGKFQRLPKADSGHEPREKVTILRKNLSPMAFAHTMPAPRADVRSS
jgi:hypothetical protein